MSTLIIIPWITHKPNNVIPVNSIISLTICWLLAGLNVYFLLAKKLITNVTVVEMILAGAFGIENIPDSANNIPISRMVLMAPIIPKRSLVMWFLSNFCIIFFRRRGLIACEHVEYII